MSATWRAASWVAAVLCAAVAIAQNPTTDTPAKTSRSASGDYRIGVEDSLAVSVWGEPDLTQTVSVRPDGKITLPLVNDVAVVGMTPEELRVRLTELLSQYIKDVNVTVGVAAINSFQVFFLGECTNQVVKFTQPVRILQALAQAGGFTDYAKKAIQIVREENGRERRIDVDYRRLLNGEEVNLYLKPGDLVICK